MEAEKTKQCRRCKEVRPVALYTKLTREKDGLNSLCKPCWYGPGWTPERKKRGPRSQQPKREPRRGQPILVPLEPVVREEPIWIRQERQLEEPEQAEPERIEPDIDIDEKATEEELRVFVKRFVVEYITKNGETADEFFCHWLPHKYPEITRGVVISALGQMLRKRKPQLRVTREERPLVNERIEFLALV